MLRPSVLGGADASFKSCAVVGSAASLLTDRFGREIDGHELVMRFNDAPVHGFEPLVGSRTTVRVLNTPAMSVILRRCGADLQRQRCTANSSCCPSELKLLNTASSSLAACFTKVRQERRRSIERRPST